MQQRSNHLGFVCAIIASLHCEQQDSISAVALLMIRLRRGGISVSLLVEGINAGSDAIVRDMQHSQCKINMPKFLSYSSVPAARQ